MLYKGINIKEIKENKKQTKMMKQVVDNYIDGKKKSGSAIIDSILKVETNDLKLYYATFANVLKVEQKNFICYTTESYVITNLEDEVIYVHPNQPIIPQTKIDSYEFIDFTSPTTQVLSNEQIAGLHHLKKFLQELENKGISR